DRVKDVAQRMRWFGGEILQARNIQFDFSSPGEGQNVELRADLRREVFLVFKEAVNNIARHSCCRHAFAVLVVHGARLVLKITDDGKGFDGAVPANGLGLKSMRE